MEDLPAQLVTEWSQAAIGQASQRGHAQVKPSLAPGFGPREQLNEQKVHRTAWRFVDVARQVYRGFDAAARLEVGEAMNGMAASDLTGPA